MPLLKKLKQYFRPARLPESDPAAVYDIWALQYDNQPDNLMLSLDEQLCTDLLRTAPVKGGIVADIGCGTGRHWSKIYQQCPSRLVGFDVSQGMLDILQQKYPQAETHLLKSNRLPELPSGRCDLVLSTLTVAHIQDIREALTEWDRVLKPGGQMIITDYHPEALAKGGQRTFRDEERVIAIRNHVHPVYGIRGMAVGLDLEVVQVIERKIDETMRPWYEKQNAVALFQRFLGVPIIYGMQLKKSNVAD